MSTEPIPKYPDRMLSSVSGFAVDALLIAMEGFRRGLTLKYYRDNSEVPIVPHTVSKSLRKHLFSLSDGDKIHYFYGSRGDKVTREMINICNDKFKTLEKFKAAGVSVAKGRDFNLSEKEEINSYAQEIGFPVVIKPTNGQMGRGVYTNITSNEEINDIMRHYEENLSYENILVEKHHMGKEYRMYTIGDIVCSAVNRIPANVTGDGVSTISQLIDEKNKIRRRNPYYKKKPIKNDFEMQRRLKELNLSEKSVIPKGEKVFLKNLSNLSAGGEGIDETHLISDEVKEMAVRALKSVDGMAQGGVDVIINPDNPKECIVLEINATAETPFHMYPIGGNPSNIAAAIIDYYFPSTKGKIKHNFYFDINDIDQALKSTVVDELTIAQPRLANENVYEYELRLSNITATYLERVRVNAVINDINGYFTKVDDSTWKLILGINKQSKLKRFLFHVKKAHPQTKINRLVKKQELDKDMFMTRGFVIINN